MAEKRRSPHDFASDEPEESWTRALPPSDGEMVEEFLGAVGTQSQPEPLRATMGLRGKMAVITGASSGIGRAIALEFAAAGIHVAFNFLDEGAESRARAQRVASELEEREVRVFCRACDVRDSEGVKAFVDEAREELGGLHFLVNNAGIGRDRALWRMGDKEWGDVLSTNLTGAFYFIRAVAPHLRAQEWGKVVNVSSVHGIRGEFGLANYISSKSGLLGLTRSAAVELGASNVNVNAVAPGYIRTTQLTDQVPAEILDRARERSVLGRLGDPQDVASVVLFLCSEGARHITGVVIPVDGGYLL
jgi:3-oxoacyl-[acyl-carrier protein] reductase